jgi:hypothetical protein
MLQINIASDEHRETKRGRRYVAGGCSNTHLDGVSLHYFPFKKEPAMVSKWDPFVRLKRKCPEGTGPNSGRCVIKRSDGSISSFTCEIS